MTMTWTRDGQEIYCDYKATLAEAAVHPAALLNFHNFLFHRRYSKAFGKRRLLILDEAHNGEQVLMGFVACTVSDAKLAKFRIPLSVPEMETTLDYAKWCNDEVIPRVSDELSSAESYLANPAPGTLSSASKRVQELRRFAGSLRWIWSSLTKEEGLKDPWVHSISEGRRGGKSIEFKPVTVKAFGSYLLSLGHNVLLLSATILSPDIVSRSLGLPKRDVEFIDVPSVFTPVRRPIVKAYLGSGLNFRNLADHFEGITTRVEEAAFMHPGMRGIVHSHSFALSQGIRDHAEAFPELQERLLFHDSKDREEVYEKFLRSTDKVLVSPSFQEGIDLPHEALRFQVIAKVPFPPAKDPQISARKDIDPGWYDLQTALTLVQSYGRGMRAPDDWANTYVVDKNFEFFVRRNHRILPGWFTEAIGLPEFEEGLGA